MAPVVKHLPSKWEAFSSNPSTAKKGRICKTIRDSIGFLIKFLKKNLSTKVKFELWF
jgi:hypothetical protein